MKFIIEYFLSVCITFTFTFSGSVSSSQPYLIVENNGPVTLGSNVTFRAVLEGHSKKEILFFTFNDTKQVTEIQSTSNEISISRKYTSSLYQEGVYTMLVEVRRLVYVWKHLFASNSTIFTLKDGIIGKILIIRENSSDLNEVDEVAVGENVTMIMDIYDPSGYLKNAQLDFLWSIDWDTYPTLNNSLVYKYNEPMTSTVMASVAATFAHHFLQTSFTKLVTVKVPVNSVNVSGNPFLHHGEILNLNVSCGGSSPFEYCWRPLKENETAANLTCVQPIVSTTCNFPITRYFQNYGTYHVGIYISNDVKEVKRVIEVMVYNVSTKPTLSTVIIPIVCTLLTLIIIAGGIAYYIHQRNQLAIEVANFDFQDSDSYTERTFFEQIFDSFMCRNCGRGQYMPNDGEVADDENFPILCDDPNSVDT